MKEFIQVKSLINVETVAGFKCETCQTALIKQPVDPPVNNVKPESLNLIHGKASEKKDANRISDSTSTLSMII